MGSGWPLTGRLSELRAITSTVGTVGEAGIVLAGAAGVGKTRLACETLARAAGRGRVCRFFVATTSAQSVSLGAFAHYADRLGPDPLARVRDVVDAVAHTSNRGPVVVVVDDAHLLDVQSALVVHQIVRRQLATVVLTVRTGEPAPDAIRALWRDELLPRLEVQPLSRAETAALLETVLAGQVEFATARRLWHYTRGNVLYLRQLVADELATDHLLQRSGVWIWDTEPAVSPTLAELIDTTIGRQPERVLDVLDVLAVADPLELAVLTDVTDPAAVSEAEIAGLITIDSDPDPPLVRLTHPMFGEVRRARAGTLRLRSLRTAVARALGPLDDPPDLIGLVRRAVLLVDSDALPDPELLIGGSMAARQLLDPITAERLARRAVKVGGGEAALRIHMEALTNCDRLGEALAVNARLIDEASTDHSRVLLILLRASIFLRSWAFGDAAALLDTIQEQVDETGLRRPYNCLRATVEVMRPCPHAAVEAATAGLTESGWLGEVFESAGTVALVAGCRDLGRLEEIRQHAERGYEVTRTAQAAPTARFTLGLNHIHALIEGGMLAEAGQVADRLAREPMDFPFALTHRALHQGLTATARGDLAAACRWLREALAMAVPLETTWLRSSVESFLATVLAMSGDPDAGRAVLRHKLSSNGFERSTQIGALAHAWVCAASGMMTEAITIAQDAAAQARVAGCPAGEVWCLQPAAQFGDPSGAARLAELSAIVQGPRVVAAASHAAALRDRDGPRLLDTARLYEAFGDRVAAADTAAQAAVVFRDHGARGSGLTATAFSRRLADETGADTPALRINATPIPFTERQREVIALARAGLSNREIADRLTMSVRSVEGHLFRASQKTGVHSREELVALLIEPVRRLR